MGGSDIFGVVLPFAVYFASKDDDHAQIDNFPFRLHYKFTSGFLFMTTAILALNDMFGKDIQCMSHDGEAAQAITQYCWVSGTYTVPGRQDTGQGLGLEDKSCSLKGGNGLRWDTSDFAVEASDVGDGAPKCRQTHNYYQWVPYMLVLQGALFLLPHKLWKILEEGKMKCISEGVRSGNRKMHEERETIIDNIAKFVSKHNKTSGHVKYAISFVFCQVLSLLNVAFNFFLLNVFFDGEFIDFGHRWISSLSDPNSHSVLTDMFPKMTLCEWKQHGQGGGLETKNYLCILATNIATEKVFIFLWFWLIILFFITLGAIMYYCILFFSKDVTWRDHFLAIAVNSTKEFQGATTDSDKMKEEEIHIFLKKLPASKFFFLYLLGHNVDYISLKLIVEKISELEKNPPGYRTSIKNKNRPLQMSSTSMSSMRHQMSSSSMTFKNISPPKYSRSDSTKSDMLEMKELTPVVPQPGGK
eukprot:GFUD01025978.1.p1 GENE.GFUD01025978.1~~GFUD01025978.1.p1  ORF type:complete len:471 (+),score=106.96 GFUD01025978.1:85-1497(+)